MDIVWFLLIGLAAGFFAGMIMKGSGFGLVGNLIVGVIGAVVGGFVFGLLGFTTTNVIGKLVSATVGAVLLLALISFLMKKKLIGK